MDIEFRIMLPSNHEDCDWSSYCNYGEQTDNANDENFRCCWNEVKLIIGVTTINLTVQCPEVNRVVIWMILHVKFLNFIKLHINALSFHLWNVRVTWKKHWAIKTDLQQERVLSLKCSLNSNNYKVMQLTNVPWYH